jgi:beta-lactamase superfamily II metal-dependent hydrolase
MNVPANSGQASLDTMPYVNLIDKPGIDDSTCELHFLDVGYGDAIFLVLPGHVTVLIDGGYEEYGEKILEYIRPYLKSRRLDWMICTHPHPDHIGGLVTVAETVDVQHLLLNMAPSKHRRLVNLASSARKRNKDIHIQVISRGDRLEPANSVQIRVLHPKDVNNDLNYSSLALMLTFKEFRVLLGGDLEQKAEKELTQTFGSELHAHVLKLPHHGNLGYSGFIPAVKPLIGIIPVAENEWGAPHEQTLGLLKKYNTRILRTDETGHVTLVLEQNGCINIRTEKSGEEKIKVIP